MLGVSNESQTVGITAYIDVIIKIIIIFRRLNRWCKLEVLNNLDSLHFMLNGQVHNAHQNAGALKII